MKYDVLAMAGQEIIANRGHKKDRDTYRVPE